MSFTKRASAGLCALAAVVCEGRAAHAQEHPAFTQQYQTWLVVNHQGSLGGRFSLVGDVQYRAWDDFSPQAVLLRNAVLYRVAEGLQVGLGYLWQPAWRTPGLTNFIDEHRIFEVLQYQYTHAGTGFSLQLRTRFEQRFRHPQDDVEFGLRARQLVRATYPLTHDRRLTVVAWDELFVNVTESGHEAVVGNGTGPTTFTPQWQFTGFDQNRAFLGLGYQIVPVVLRVELGYMNQYVRRPNNPSNGGDLMAHTTLLQLFTTWR